MRQDIVAALFSRCADVHLGNRKAGWWDFLNDAEGYVDPSLVSIKVTLIVSEYCEAVEGQRKNKVDDHLPQYRNEPVEIADAAIRTMDFLGFMLVTCAKTSEEWAWALIDAEDHLEGLEFDDAMKVRQFCASNIFLGCSNTINGIHTEGSMQSIDIRSMCSVLTAIAALGELMEREYSVNFLEVIAAKEAYNAIRADHKAEARAAVGGKKF